MKTELRVLFFSPIAWIVLIVFAFQVGLGFCDSLGDQLRRLAMGYTPSNVTSTLLVARGGMFSAMLGHLYLYIPLLTMGLMSRELSSGSIKLLYSSPVSNLQIVLGKYLSAVVYGLILMAIMLLPMIFTMLIVKDVDIPYMFTALLGIFLTTCAYASIGLFMSAITRYQVVAAIGTLAILTVLNFIGDIGQNVDFVRDVTYWLSISGRSRIFLEGMICSRDIIYFILVILMFLTFTFIKLQGERLKKSVVRTVGSYFFVFAVIVSAGYVSSRPWMIAYYDATATKRNTLTENSQKVMEKLEGGLTITTYANLLDKTWFTGSPAMKNKDMQLFERYIRFKPEIKMEYVYYYGKGTDEYYDKAYAGLSSKERMLKVCEYESDTYKPEMFISEEEANQIDDISAENGRFVRVLKRDNGKKAYLRIYEDQYMYPFESEITAALKTLVDKSPLIGFVTGHGERSGKDYGEKGFAAFATDRTFRNALINQGFQVEEVTLGQPVPAGVDVLVLADLRADLTPEEYANYISFVDRGGNLVVMGEPKRRSFMNPLMEKLGLQFADGILVFPSREYEDDIIASRIMDGALKVSPYFASLIRQGNTIITPSACGVEIIDTTKGFEITEVLATPSKGSWAEYETTDFLNEKSVLNPERGETERSNAVMLYLTREVEGKPQQRIFVIGDADCLANKEMSLNRAGLNGSNFRLITEMFRCLSYDEYPVETGRIPAPDNDVYLPQGALIWVKMFFIGLLPLSILVGCVVFLMKRKRR